MRFQDFGNTAVPVVATTMVLAACGEPAAPPIVAASESGIAADYQPLLNSSADGAQFGPAAALRFEGDATGASHAIELINARLAEQGAPIALQKVEWVTPAGADEAGQTVFANDRQLRLDSRWVPGDPRRGATGNDLTHLVFQGFAWANGALNGEPAIDRSFDTWNAVHCSALRVNKVADTGVWPSILLTLGGVSGNPFLADISTIGFLPGFIFDVVLGPGASSFVLGVTFTFIWTDVATGQPTDIDNDNRTDTALKEIWYNDNFLWKTGAGPGTDIETVAFHENGHALELGHFGRVAINNRTGALQVSPRAAMNAFILGTLRDPLPTDHAAFCSNFGGWPR
jgi:hypothetical protein